MKTPYTSTHEKLTGLFKEITEKFLRNNIFLGEGAVGIFHPSVINHTLTEFCKNASEKINREPASWDLWIKKVKNEQNQVIDNFFLKQSHPKKPPSEKNHQSQHNEQDAVFQLIEVLHQFNRNIILKTIDEWTTSEDNRRKMRFFSKILLETASPLNHPFISPDILNATIQEKGENFERGFSKLWGNLQSLDDPIFSSQLYKHNFKLGENIACTNGFVVYQNQFCQLIHYQATKQSTHKTPLLIVPSWINKYYIFDLSPSNSMVRWCLEQGQDVLIISWVNPDQSDQDATFDQYIIDGLLNCITWMEKSLPVKSVNLMGYCVGGTMVLCLIAYLKQLGQNHRVTSATLIATPIDFSYMDEMATFVCDRQLKNLEDYVQEHGVIQGTHLRLLFSFLRTQDLIWPSIVNNYFLGKEEEIIDFIFWNHDCINVPGTLHTQYLREIFHQNAFVKKNDLKLGGQDIDISEIQQPIYMVSFEKDHIVPWRSSYEGLKLLPNVQFVLGGSGHVVGAINPPHNNKYGYKVFNNEGVPAAEYKGSWWIHWNQWITEYAGELEKSQDIAEEYILEKAPGSFALKTTT